MILFKCEVFIKTLVGLGIDQNKIIFVVAKDNVEASDTLTKKFNDSEIKNISLMNEPVFISASIKENAK